MAGVHRTDLAAVVALVVGEEPEVVHRAGHVAVRLSQGLAHVRGVESRQLARVGLHDVSQPVQGRCT